MGSKSSSGGERVGFSAEESASLDRAIRALPPLERRVLLLSRLRGFSHAEIARDTGLKEAEVRTTLIAILVRLAKQPGEAK